MFDDPCLIVRCDLPVGWYVDGESSLFRIVFRPLDRRDERIVLSVFPTLVAPTVSNEDWVDVAKGFLELGSDERPEPLHFAAGTAITGRPMTANDSSYHRVVVRGRTMDLIADHVQPGAENARISSVLLRIASSARTPARPPYVDTDGSALDEAYAAVGALSEDSDADSFIQAYLRLETATEDRWLRSLLRPDHRIDLDAFKTLLASRLMLGQIPAYLLKLYQGHTMLMRARPDASPSAPYVAVDEGLRPLLTPIAEEMFGGVLRALRRRNDLQKDDVSDDALSSHASIQKLLGTLIINAVRSAFQYDRPASPAAAHEGLRAHLYALEAAASSDLDTNSTMWLDGLLLLGRTLTACVEAAQHEDDRDSVVETATYLTGVGRKLFQSAAPGDKAELYRSEGATYAATGLINHASALVKTADRVSLEDALSLLSNAYQFLRSAPKAYVDKVNAAHNEALAALQLGDVAMVREAVGRGRSVAEKINLQFQIQFFDWAIRIASVIEAAPPTVRTIPELEYLRAESEGGKEKALRAVCSSLERELADDPTGATTIEWLVLAAQILGGNERIFAAASALLDLKRLLVSSERELQLGSDDSLLARRLATETLADSIRRGALEVAVAAADRARARSLLLDLTLPAGQTAHLREAIENGYNPGISRLMDAMLKDREPRPFRIPSWDGPLGLRIEGWLERLSRDLLAWVNTLTEPLGASTLTADEIMATARAHGQPVLVLHPTEERVALLLITSDGAIRHFWSTATTPEILAQAERLRENLGVWVSARDRDERARLVQSGGTILGYRAAAAALYRSLIQPLREHLNGHTHLTITPFRELASVPFALLEDEAGTPLVESFAISLVPSIATLKFLKQRSPLQEADTNATGRSFAYLVGDPATPDALKLQRLPGAAVEAAIVRERLAAAHADLAILYKKDQDATPKNYLKEAPGAQLVHLACHAGVGLTASASALYMAPGSNGDSTLDFGEIAQARLNNALVFIAACRSGAGRATADGTVGLAREFLRAGARAVVASYWNVSDEATRIMVDHFYNRFLRGSKPDGPNNESLGVAAALREAMLMARDDLSREAGSTEPVHPAGWGPFFVIGDGNLKDELGGDSLR